jgi:hypothetical protein
MFQIEGFTAVPSPPEAEELNVVSKMLSDTMAEVKKFTEEDIANLNKALNEAGVPRITVIEVPPPGRGR